MGKRNDNQKAQTERAKWSVAVIMAQRYRSGRVDDDWWPLLPPAVLWVDLGNNSMMCPTSIRTF